MQKWVTNHSSCNCEEVTLKQGAGRGWEEVVLLSLKKKGNVGQIYEI